MANLLFYPLIPLLFFAELFLVGPWSPHLVLLAFVTSLICDVPSLPRRIYAVMLGAASALVHNMSVPYTVAGMLACLLLWNMLQHSFTRNRVTQSLLAIVMMVGLLVLGGDFSWTVRFLIANIIIVPVMVWLWCEV